MAIIIDNIITSIPIILVLLVLIIQAIRLFLKREKEKTIKIKIILQSIRMILFSIFIGNVLGFFWHSHLHAPLPYLGAPDVYCESCEKASQNLFGMSVSLILYIITIIITIIVHKKSKNEVLAQDQKIK